eukprot:TRINITY_DN14235_c1_g1_i1.p1 TRINITY_DN14235_c1_g1~~TRINITY_DN14235_c1_g1_i1.p1  ORF type:complete len:449 (+),score=99.94 TRINITY_DN14235_c1_g1_i1:136-1482(+)
MSSGYGGFGGGPGRDRSRSPRQGGQQGGAGGASTEEIQRLIILREQARLSKDFGQADTLRDRLKAFSVNIYDKTNSWSCMDGRAGKIPTFNEIQALGGRPPPMPSVTTPPPAMPTKSGFGGTPGMPGHSPAPEATSNWNAMPASFGGPTQEMQPLQQQEQPAQQQFSFPPMATSMAPPQDAPSGGIAAPAAADPGFPPSMPNMPSPETASQAGGGMGGMPNMMMPGVPAVPTMPGMTPDMQAQPAQAMQQPQQLAGGGAAPVPGADMMGAPGGNGVLPGGMPDMSQQYAAQMAGMPLGTDPAQLAQMQQMQQMQQLHYLQQMQQAQQLQQMYLQQQQALAGMALPTGLGTVGGMSPVMPTAKSSSPDVQTALGIMSQIKAAGRSASDAELTWLVEAREKVRKAKDWTGGDELRTAMKQYLQVEFLEKEKRWKSADGREGMIPMWSSLP